MTNSLEDEVKRIVASMDNEQNNQEQEIPGIMKEEAQPEETIHIHYFPDAIVILKEDENTAQVVDSEPVIPPKISFMPAYAICSFYLFLIFSSIAFQVYALLNPPIATVTIIPKSHTVTLSGTLQMGRLLQPITIGESQTVPATGRGYQPAEQARGFITFYNGQFQMVTIAAGTILTAFNGVQIITEQDAYIPAESQTIPPSLGHITVSAHAMGPGVKGNIPTGDIDEACCAPSILAQNTAPFYNGQDEKVFTTVTKSDVTTVATTLKSSLSLGMEGALTAQVKPQETLSPLPCSPTVTPDHKVGDEAIQVKVTVSLTCSAIAYDTKSLESKARALLTTQARKELGSGYSLLGNIQVSVKHATVTRATTYLVFLSFHASGTWIYALNRSEQERIKKIIRGKNKQEALLLLAALPGIAQASIAWSDDTRLPKNPNYMHILLIYELI